MDIAFTMRDEEGKLQMLFSRTGQTVIPRVDDFIFYKNEEYVITNILWNYDKDYVGYVVEPTFNKVGGK